MDLSIKWINETFAVKIPLQPTNNLSKLLTYYNFNPDYLTLNGFEIEHLYTKKEPNFDIKLELDTTPNRRDVLYASGLYHELSALLNLPFQEKPIFTKNISFPQKPTYCKAVIKGERPVFIAQLTNIENRKSPPWLQMRLDNSSGNNLINDLITYIELEWGHRIQIFDLNQITNFNLKLTKELDPIQNKKQPTLVLKNGNKVLSIANLQVNQDFTINQNPINNYLLVCIPYTRTEIQKINKNRNLKVETSKLLSKGVIFNNAAFAFQRILKLITLYYPKSKIKLGPCFDKDYQTKIINVNLPNTKKILGQSKLECELSEKEIINCLTRLHFISKKQEQKNLQVQIPISRSGDLEEEIDIIEEIGRIYCFNNFKNKLPLPKRIGKISQEQKILNKIKTYLINNGFHEFMNYAFRQETDDKQTYKILNGIGIGNQLQTNISINLIELIKYNLNQQQLKINRGFEIARVFHKTKNQEYNFCCGFITNEKLKTNWIDNETQLNWFQAKSLVENMLKYLTINIEWIQSKTKHGLLTHPSRSAVLQINKTQIGFLTQINPIVAKKYNIPLSTFFFELNITSLSQILNKSTEIKYHPYSSYPKITKDISITVSNKKPINHYTNELIRIINNVTKYVTELRLINNYEFEKENLKYRTLTYSLTFQSRRQTLLNQEVETSMEALSNELRTELRIH